MIIPHNIKILISNRLSLALLGFIFVAIACLNCPRCSRKILIDTKVAPFRNVFSGYELLAYLSYRVPKLGCRCVELSTVRRYRLTGSGNAPTKFTGVKGNWAVFQVLFLACFGVYNSPLTQTGLPQ